MYRTTELLTDVSLYAFVIKPWKSSFDQFPLVATVWICFRHLPAVFFNDYGVHYIWKLAWLGATGVELEAKRAHCRDSGVLWMKNSRDLHNDYGRTLLAP